MPVLGAAAQAGAGGRPPTSKWLVGGLAMKFFRRPKSLDYTRSTGASWHQRGDCYAGRQGWMIVALPRIAHPALAKVIWTVQGLIAQLLLEKPP